MKPGLVAAFAGLTLLLAPIPEVRPDDPARDGSVASLAGAAFRPVWRHLLGWTCRRRSPRGSTSMRSRR